MVPAVPAPITSNRFIYRTPSLDDHTAVTLCATAARDDRIRRRPVLTDLPRRSTSKTFEGNFISILLTYKAPIGFRVRPRFLLRIPRGMP